MLTQMLWRLDHGCETKRIFMRYAGAPLDRLLGDFERTAFEDETVVCHLGPEGEEAMLRGDDLGLQGGGVGTGH